MKGRGGVGALQERSRAAGVAGPGVVVQVEAFHALQSQDDALVEATELVAGDVEFHELVGE